MRCEIKNNNPIFVFFKENTDVVISQFLDYYLEDQLNKDIYDVMIETLGKFEGSVPGRSLLSPERGPRSDSFFLMMPTEFALNAGDAPTLITQFLHHFFNQIQFIKTMKETTIPTLFPVWSMSY